MTSRFILIAAALGVTAITNAQDKRPVALMVGDPAPPLTVGKWVKGQPVYEFKNGEVYVVEFWATWCGPCKQTIPHLTELQKKHGEKVKVVGVAVWENDQADVEPFVKEMGDKMAYRVALDKLPKPHADGAEGAMAKGWMQAAGQNGIPAAFIVDADGKVAWIGHPMAMAEPLQRVLEGTWDAKAHAAQARADVAERAKAMNLRNRFRAALQEKNWDQAIKVADEVIASGDITGHSMKVTVLAKHKKDFPAAIQVAERLMEDEETRPMGAFMKWSVLLDDVKDYEKAYSFGKGLVSGTFKDNWSALNSIAWAIVDPQGTVSKKDLGLALSAAQRSVALERNHYNVDTLARVYWLKRDKARAIKLQKEAVKLAPEAEKADMEKTLKEYQGG